MKSLNFDCALRGQKSRDQTPQKPKMQGRQNMSNTERKGPHKSMHCKFCKPPGVVTPEKSARAQLETKTKIHLVHEAADLRVCNIHNELVIRQQSQYNSTGKFQNDAETNNYMRYYISKPGFPAVESEACICVLEGENSCPKCAPDKNRPPPKKKVCRCPKGAKPHPSMYNVAAPKKKKQIDEDEEFWWEKYSREHDALAKETWAAYMAQRRKDKKLEKCQKREKMAAVKNRTKGVPTWYQRLSCQQMIYVEYLSTAIRLDSDENITDRTYFVLGGIGLHPRPKKKVLKRCLRFCHYNSIQFLNQLQILIKDEDPFLEKRGSTAEKSFSWNDRLIMNSMCYLEFPGLLRELMDRLPPLPRTQILPQIPYPVFPKLPKKKYDNPYEEPIWQDRLNWVEKMQIDRLNRCRLHMETKRVKIPPLALVRRPSLIDARPPFLSQIEANERASRRLAKEKKKKLYRKHRISTFNSAVDVTAIAGIEASEISTTEKADTDDICVFLREPKETDSVEGEGEGEEGDMDLLPEKDVRFLEEPPKSETQVRSLRIFSEEFSGEGAEDIPFKTPPKTGSGATIASPCPPPDATPGPPAIHFDKAKRELDIRNEEICGFFPFVSSSTQTVKADLCSVSNDVEANLKSAAEKLKKFANDDTAEPNPRTKEKKKPKKKEKCKKKVVEKKSKKPKTTTEKTREQASGEAPDSIKENAMDGEAERYEHDEAEEEEEDGQSGMQISFKIEKGREKKGSQRDSEVSDPDPDSEDEWSTRFPCVSETGKSEEGEMPSDATRVNKRRKGKSSKRKPRKKKASIEKRRVTETKGKSSKNLKREPGMEKTEKENAVEYNDANEEGKAEKEEKDRKEEVFRGDVEPLVTEIIKDLAEEGFHCASYPLLSKHPEVDQLILHLKGEIVNKQLRETLHMIMKLKWGQMKGSRKFPIQELGVSTKKLERANWNDKKWISQLAKVKKDQFYYKVANDRAEYAMEFDNTLYQSHFGTERYHMIFNAYMISRYEDAILRGIF